jgi:hypothetical protein
MEGGASGSVVAELGEVEYLCPPGVSFPIPIKNTVLDPAEYWLGFEVSIRFSCFFHVTERWLMVGLRAADPFRPQAKRSSRLRC